MSVSSGAGRPPVNHAPDARATDSHTERGVRPLVALRSLYLLTLTSVSISTRGALC